MSAAPNSDTTSAPGLKNLSGATQIEVEQGLDPERLALGSRGPSHDVCAVNCCLLGGR